MQYAHLYAGGREIAVGDTHDLIQRLRDDDGAFGWIDLTTEDASELGRLAELLHLHELAVEDALSDHERPKLARYSTHLLLTISSSSIDDTGRVHLQRFTGFILPNLFISVREAGFPIDDLRQRLELNDDLIEHGVAFLLLGRARRRRR